MGACIGKKSSKYSNRYHPQSDIIKAPHPTIQNDILLINSSLPAPSEKPSMINQLTVDNDGEDNRTSILSNDGDDNRTSLLNRYSVDSQLRYLLEQQEIIAAAFIQPFASRFVSMTDTELEFELANIMCDIPENDGTENKLGDSTLKSSDV